MKVFTRAASAICLLNLGCSLQPSQQLPPVAGLAAAPHAVSLTVHIVPAKQLLGLGTLHYWTAADINLYRVQLQMLQGGSYVNVGSPVDLPQQPGSTQLTSATFSNLAGNNDYHVTVQAYGDVGGATTNTLLDLVMTTIVDFDFRTPTQNLPTTLANSGTVTLDNTTFAGALTVTSTGTPGGTASMLAQLWSGSTLVTSQSFGATSNSFVFNNLVAGTTYFVKLMAQDGSSNVLATGTSANQTFTGQNVSPTASLAVTLVAPAATGATLGLFTLGAKQVYVAVDATTQNVWAAEEGDVSANAPLVEEFSSTGSVLSTFSPAAHSFSDAVAVDPLNDHVWVGYQLSSGNLAELTSTGSVLGTFTAGNSVYAVAVDPIDEHVWAAVPNLNKVIELTSTGSVLGTFTVGTSPESLAVDPVTENVWVANFTILGTVTELTSTGSVLGTFSVGQNPIGVAVDAISHDVWVANSNTNNVTELTSTGSVLVTVTASGAYAVAVDPSKHNVWVALNSSPGRVLELTSTGSVLGTFSVSSGPLVSVTVDTNGHVWVGGQNGNMFELQD